LQKQIYRLEDKRNKDKLKISDLLNQIEEVKNLKEFDHKDNAIKLKDALSEIQKLKKLNINLGYLYILHYN